MDIEQQNGAQNGVLPDSNSGICLGTESEALSARNNQKRHLQPVANFSDGPADQQGMSLSEANTNTRAPGGKAATTGGPIGTDAELAESFSAVVSLLWNEREALETLYFKLLQEQLLLQAGETRWLARADAEVADAIRHMRMSEVLRAAEMERILVDFGLPVDATLAQLADHATAINAEPWGMVLNDHRAALRQLVADVQAAGHQVRVLLSAGANAIRETLDVLTQTVATYNATGVEVERDFGSLLLDEQA